jgi:hypothetical protein
MSKFRFGMNEGKFGMDEGYVDLVWEIICYYNDFCKQTDMDPHVRAGMFASIL